MKKKESYYNNIVKIEDMFLLFNSLTKSHLILSEELYNVFENYKEDFKKLEKINGSFYKVLKNNGFIVELDCNEKEYVNNLRFLNKFDNNQYDLTINPSMSCNLKCWYCYENHIEKSMMNFITADKIIKHIKMQFNITHFKKLHLSFFGGEPLLNKRIITYIVDKVNSFCNEFTINFTISFTTNGTLFNDIFLNFLSKYKVRFQITLDGDKKLHDKVRYFKNSNKGSYDCILKNIEKICNKMEDYSITLRINFNEDTLDNIKNAIDQLSGIKSKDNIVISLHKVWQINEDKINSKKIFEIISYINTKGFKVNYPHLEISSPCYADSFNQAVVNYDGKIYKCTARDFTKHAADGELIENGMIIWNLDKRLNRHYKNIQSICRDCKLLPACSGICSQLCLEHENQKCHLENSNFTKDDFVIYNFNKNYL